MDTEGTSKSNSSLIAIIVVLVILLAGALAGGYWAFGGRQDYKNNADKKIAAAVAAAEKAQAAKLQASFAEQLKSPYKAFRGSQTYGSITFAYPNSWSAYVDESQSSQPINGYFHPNQVPGIQAGAAYALRVELINSTYNQVLQPYSDQVSNGKVTATAYIPPKMKSNSSVQPGTYIKGAISQSSSGQDNNGAMLIISVRDKTLKIYTESNDFLSDFNNIILASLTFVP